MAPPAAPELAPGQAPTSPGLVSLEPRAGAGNAPAFLDLCAGSGSASRAAKVRGWDVLRVDVAEGTAADVRADIADPALVERLRRQWDVVWCSPPCQGFSTARADGGRTCDLTLVRACLRIVDELRPRWWVLENVHGATRAIGSLIGPPVAVCGSFYLWGNFPPFVAVVPRNKTKLSGRRRAERRAAIPWQISEGLTLACESLLVEWGRRWR